MKADSKKRINDVSINWQLEAPFFAEFLLRFKLKEDNSIQTAAIQIKDRSFTLLYNDEFIQGLSKVQLKGVLVHEILHIVHEVRLRSEGKDLELINIAQDACINDAVEKTAIGREKLSLPDGVVTLKQIHDLGYNGEPITEPIYDFLKKKKDENTLYVSISINGDGGGGDGENTLRTTDDHTIATEPLSEVDKTFIESTIRNAIMRGAGQISGNFIEEVKRLVATKKINWQKKLYIAMNKYIEEPGYIYENSWSKRNRRSLPLPGIKKRSKQIVIGVDTSGSISNDDFDKFFYQVEKILKTFDNCTLIQWDTTVTDVRKYKKGMWKTIKMKGRGGTTVQPLYDYIKEKLPKTNILVNFTDGGLYDINSFDTYGVDTIWVITGSYYKYRLGDKIKSEKIIFLDK